MKFKGAFTLIELLVVIAIIAILAAILFPVFAHAREKAHQATCFSNHKNLMLAFMQYMNDYDERFPLFPTPCWDWANNDPRNTNPPFWIRVDPYLKNRDIWKDPASKRGCCFRTCSAARNRWGWGPAQGVDFRISYGYSEALMNNCRESTRIASMVAPVETHLISDAVGAFIAPWSTGPHGINTRIAFAERYEDPGPCCGELPASPDDNTRHLGGSNIGLADGHAKWYRWSNIRMRREIEGRRGWLRIGACEIVGQD